MEEFVQLKLGTYIHITENTRELEKSIDDLEEERESLLSISDEQNKTIIKLHKYIMGINLISYKLKDYPLVELIDFDNYMTFAINYKDALLVLGITKEEMVEFIKEKYNEWKQEEELKHGNANN